MRMSRALRLSVPSVVALSMVSACGGGGSGGSGDENTLDIALVVHQTGPFADTGRMKLIGAQLAVDEINAAGGIEALDGAKLNLITHDAGDSVTSAVSAVNRALEDDVIAGLGTGISSTTIAVTEVAERRAIPWLTVSFEDAITERGFKYTFATSPKTSEFNELYSGALEELAGQDGITIDRVGIIAGTNVVAANSADQLRSIYAPEYGWDVVLDETIEEGTLSDATPIAQSISQNDPQLLLVGAAISDIQKVSRKQVEMGMTPVPWVLNGAPYLSGAFLEALGEDAVNGTFAVASAAPFAGQEELAEKIRERGDNYPQEYHLAPYSHVYLLKEAMEQAGSAEPDAIREALQNIDVEAPHPAAIPWPAQRVRFDETGRAVDRVAVLVQWQGTKSVTVYPADLAQGDAIWPTLDGDNR